LFDKLEAIEQEELDSNGHKNSSDKRSSGIVDLLKEAEQLEGISEHFSKHSPLEGPTVGNRIDSENRA